MVEYKSLEKAEKHEIVCVHLWSGLAYAIKVAIFVKGRFYKIALLKSEKLRESKELAFIRGKIAKEYLRQRNLRVTQNKSLTGIEQRLV